MSVDTKLRFGFGARVPYPDGLIGREIMMLAMVFSERMVKITVPDPQNNLQKLLVERVTIEYPQYLLHGP